MRIMNHMQTHATSHKEICRQWYKIDAKGKILGKLAVAISRILTGKDKVIYVPYLDIGDYVIVINASQFALSGDKAVTKLYYRHSGYPGGLKKAALRDKKPEDVLRHAVAGMLPRTRLGRAMIKKLFIFGGPDHNKGEKQFIELTI